jgi:hypothetical protein
LLAHGQWFSPGTPASSTQFPSWYFYPEYTFLELSYLIFDFFVFNATFNNISAISWRPVLVVEEAGVPGERNCSYCNGKHAPHKSIRLSSIKKSIQEKFVFIFVVFFDVLSFFFFFS